MLSDKVKGVSELAYEVQGSSQRMRERFLPREGSRKVLCRLRVREERLSDLSLSKGSLADGALAILPLRSLLSRKDH